MRIVHQTPILSDVTGKDLKKFWQGHVATDGADYFTYSTFWQELAGGGLSKMQESEKTRVSIKNVGRSNQTTLEQQAISEMNSDEKKHRDKGYRAEGEIKNNKLLPMLAQDYRKAAHRIKFPVVVQPKYDGNRAITDGFSMWSRKAIDFPSEIVAHLIGGERPCPPELLKAAKSPASTIHPSPQLAIDIFAMEPTFSEQRASDAQDLASNYPQIFSRLDTMGHLIDGELIMPPGVLLQKTRSATSKYSELSHSLLYRVYDIFIEDMPYLRRYEVLKEIVEKAKNPNIVLAPYQIAHTIEDIFTTHRQYRDEGWEGSIVRQLDEGYRVNKRVVQLIKVKDFKEEEFTVVDVINAGDAKMEGCAKFIMSLGDGSDKTFECLPEGTMEHRRKLLLDRELQIGKRWTVRWPDDDNGGLSEDGKPKYAYAVAERPDGV